MSNKQRERYRITLTCEVMRGSEKISEHATTMEVLGERGGFNNGIGDADHIAQLRDGGHKLCTTVVDAGLSKAVNALTQEYDAEQEEKATAGGDPAPGGDGED